MLPCMGLTDTAAVSSVFDDVRRHTGGDFLSGPDSSAACTHMGLFLSWAVTRGFASTAFRREHPRTLAALPDGAVTGSEVLERCWDDALVAEASTEKLERR